MPFVVACATSPIAVEVLEREADRIHQPVALDAVGAHAMVQHLLAHRRFLRVAGGVGRLRLAAAERPAGGSGGLMPRRFVMIHLPRVTGEVRSGFDVVVEERALAEQPAAQRPGPGRA